LVTPEMLPPPLDKPLAPSAAALQQPAAAPLPAQASVANGEIRPLWIVEKETIERAIELCEGNIPKAAALLEISPSTIYRKKLSWQAA
jgi:DNA-binding NtrC family response regulator